jgi:hypothetical protein
MRTLLGSAKHCWGVRIEGDLSKGVALVWERADGILEADLAS